MTFSFNRFPGSSMVERSAVNRNVAGSSPARGANLSEFQLTPDWAISQGKEGGGIRRLVARSNA
jgi:hypothetical protein